MLKLRTIMALTAISMLFLSCIRNRCVEGNTQLVSEKRHLESPFSGIDLQVPFDMEIVDNNSDTLSLKAESNIMNLIITEVKNGVLHIKTPHGKCVQAREKVILYCKISGIKTVSVDGSGSIYCKELPNATSCNIGGSGNVNIDKICSKEFSAKIEGSGDISIDSVTSQLCTYSINGSGNIYNAYTKSNKVVHNIDGSGSIKSVAKSNEYFGNIKGSGNIVIQGSSNDASIQINSSGEFDGFGFKSSNCNAEITGSGSIKITVTNSLKAKITGSGSVTYEGSPSVSKQITGSGDVFKR